MYRCFVFVWVLLMVISCQKSIRLGATIPPFSISKDCKCDKKVSNDSLGTMQCGAISLQYIKSIQANTGPLTEEEKFALAFKGKYHTVFFEKLRIDEKLYKMFIDSVEIIRAIPIAQSTSKPFILCSACNYVAELKFRNRSFSYPYFATDATNDQNGILEISKQNRIQRKVYKTQDGLGSGIYFKYLDKKMQHQNLSVEVLNVCDTALVNIIFNSIKYPNHN